MTSAERKLNTEKLLTSRQIPYIDHLPFIEEEYEVVIRSPHDIAKRILILTYLCYVAEAQHEKQKVIEFLRSEDLWKDTTFDEQELFQKDLTDAEKIKISWSAEAIWLLLWAIEKADELDFPEAEVNVPDILSRLPALMTSTKNFVEQATIRKTPDLLDAADLLYRLHWAVRNSQLNNLELPQLNPGVISERHYAINWVIYRADKWDEVSTDT